MDKATSGRKPLGEILLEQGSITEEKLREALQVQAATTGHRMIGQILLSRGYVKRHHIDIALAKQRTMR